MTRARVQWFAAGAMLLLMGAAGCGRSGEVDRLVEETASLRAEVASLRAALDDQRKRVDEAMQWYQEHAPRLAELRSEARDFERQAEAFVELTRGEATPEMRAMIRDVLREMDQGRNAWRRQRRRVVMEDWHVRAMAELAAMADLSPQQQRQIERFEREEQEEVFDSLVRLGTPRRRAGQALLQVIEQARQHKEEKVIKVLSPEQYRTYRMFHEQGLSLLRGGFNRRMQAPQAGQADW